MAKYYVCKFWSVMDTKNLFSCAIVVVFPKDEFQLTIDAFWLMVELSCDSVLYA